MATGTTGMAREPPVGTFKSNQAQQRCLEQRKKTQLESQSNQSYNSMNLRNIEAMNIAISKR
ncbi:hypothetical protein H5410_003059 [Solanum commersonii]|uniref:Uncharacterized protein n=1 Tax=Solanum commersonii TaxID=4109 RepID=A0A9J6B3N8_SOLCO|nr:hypothetical protein H5410_003059 [Solanum commersonii]